MIELPNYGLRAYALFYARHGTSESFGQGELDWIVSEPMRKKIFALLLRAGWIMKSGRREYRCVSPEKAIRGLLEFRVPEVLMRARMEYALTGLSAVEVWSDYAYVQRGFERSPYFIKVLGKELHKWQGYLSGERVPNYVRSGSTIGEFVVLVPVERLNFEEKGGLKVEPLKETVRNAKGNYMHDYALNYIRKKYGKRVGG